MLVKLSNLIVVNRDPNDVDISGPSSLLGYYTHPLVLGGGIAGGFAANELMEKFIPDKKEITVSRVGGKSLFGIPYGGKFEGKISKGSNGTKRRLLWNIGRGVLASVGSGIAATGVAAYRRKNAQDGEEMLVKLSYQEEKNKKHNVAGFAATGGLLGAGAGYSIGPGIVEGIGLQRTHDIASKGRAIASHVEHLPGILQQVGDLMEGRGVERALVSGETANALGDVIALQKQLGGDFKARPRTSEVKDVARSAHAAMRESALGQAGKKLRVVGKLSEPASRTISRITNSAVDHIVEPVGSMMTRNAVQKAERISPIIGGLLGMGILGGGAALANLNHQE